MRLGLTQSLRTEQRLVQSPQMIQAMQVLQCPMMELKDQIEAELQENVFLEIPTDEREERTAGEAEPSREATDAPAEGELSLDERLQNQYASEVEQLEARSERGSRAPRAPRARRLPDRPGPRDGEPLRTRR